MVKTYEERIKEANDKRVKRLEKAREKYARDKANKNGIWAYQKERDKAKKEERAKKKEQKENIEKSRIIKNNIDNRIRMAKKRLEKSKSKQQNT
tara:strand:+ start:468 stop:749 length:282 start_codon:yes stop_codon:yes gene_type:complete